MSHVVLGLLEQPPVLLFPAHRHPWSPWSPLGASRALALTGSENGPDTLLRCIHNIHVLFSGVLCILFTHTHYDTTSANPEKITQWMYIFG